MRCAFCKGVYNPPPRSQPRTQEATRRERGIILLLPRPGLPAVNLARARHLLPLPPWFTAGPRRLRLRALRRRSNTSPQNPKTTPVYAVHSNFGFSQVPNNTKAQWGQEPHTGGVVFWGFGATGKRPAPVLAAKDPVLGAARGIMAAFPLSSNTSRV